MRYQVKLVFEYGAPRPNVKRIAGDLALRMAKTWERALRSGQQPSGESLPTNKMDEPMGLGSGSFANFETSKPRSGKSREGLPTGQATVVPGRQEDPRYIIAWHDLRRNKGFDGWSIDGDSEAVFLDATDEAVAEYVREWNATIKRG